MCKPYWTEYTRALGKARRVRKAADADPVVVRAREGIAEREAQLGRRPARTSLAPKPEPIRTRPARGRKTEGNLIVEAVDAAIVREATERSPFALPDPEPTRDAVDAASADA